MGVWIETYMADVDKRIVKVAPYVGVWIETDIAPHYGVAESVAPYVGVWIETECLKKAWAVYKSHPMWVCGLKL